MTQPSQVNQDYYEWLTSQISIPNGNSYNELFTLMHEVEFVWTVPNDDNRIHDGLDLRTEFANTTYPQFRLQGLELDGATFLEVLVALSRRTAFTAGGDQEEWAWALIRNLRLHKKSDPLSENDIFKVNDTLYSLIWRTYRPDGRGGFFPLKNPEEDQTKVEIWYQMNKYVIEGNSL